MSGKDKLTIGDEINIAVQSGLQLIPYVGGAISTAYFGRKQEKAFKRVERLYSELASELSTIKTQIVPIESQDEDGLISLIEQVNDKVENEHQEIKFQSYKKFMKNILTDPVNSSNYDKRKTFLDIIEHISIIELEILVFLYKNFGVTTQVKNISKPGVNQYAIVGAINKLKSYGFLRTAQGSFSIGGNNDNLLEEIVSVNEYAKEFIEFSIA